jgi:hypothetical protein
LSDKHHHYEYAGFQYIIIETPDGSMTAFPKPGQHPAANKEKHRMAAISCFKQDRR